MPPTLHTDALVVGGGPAGSVAALELARAGWRVLLVDRGARGRDKTCGSCLSPRALATIDRLGLTDAVRSSALGETRVVRLIAHPRRSLAFAHQSRGGEPGLVVDRRTLDAALLDEAVAAGVDVRYDTAAVLSLPRVRLSTTSAGRRDTGVDSATTDRTPAVRDVEPALMVGADGLGSGVARALGWTGAAGRAFGFSGDTAGEALMALEPGEIRLHLLSEGYLGAVRRGDGRIHWGALVRDSAVDRRPLAILRHFAQRFQLDELTHLAEAATWIAAGPISWQPARRAAAGAVLVGDAAGYAEPLTGEGMTWAFECGELLGRVARTGAPGTFTAGQAAQYDTEWRRAIGAAQRRATLLARPLRMPGLAAMVARLIPALPRYAAARLSTATGAGLAAAHHTR